MNTVEKRLRADAVALIAAGGALGALARYSITRVIHVAPDSFPWATFVTNLSGAFVLGLFLAFGLEHVARRRVYRLRLFFAVGFLGAYTTFSTMAVETVTLSKDGFIALAVGYLLLSITAGLAVTYLGIVLARTAARRSAGG